MLMFTRKIRKNKKGFTLTELIVVVAILGVLAAIATPLIANNVQTAKNNADSANLKIIQSAVTAAIAEGDIALDSSNNITTSKANTVAAIQARIQGGAIPASNNTSNAYYIKLARAEVVSLASTTAEGSTYYKLN